MSELMSPALPFELVAPQVEPTSPAGPPTANPQDQPFDSLVQALAGAPAAPAPPVAEPAPPATGQIRRVTDLMPGLPPATETVETAVPAPATDPASDPSAQGRRMTELEFLFQRHAGKPFTMLGQPSQAPTVLQPVAAADNPRLASVLAMLLPDSAPPPALAASDRATAPLLPTPFFNAPAAPAASPIKMDPVQRMAVAGPRRDAGTSVSEGSARDAAKVGVRDASFAGDRILSASAAPPAMAAGAAASTASGLGPGTARAPAGGASTPASVIPLPGTGPAPAPVATATTAVQAPALPPATAQVADQIAWMVQTGQHTAQVRLHPEEMGVVHIRVALDPGGAQVSIDASHPDMVQELTSSAPRLRNLLAGDGVGLNFLEIDHRQPGQQQSGDRWRGGEPHTSGRDSELASESDDPDRELDALPAMMAQQANLRLLDLFA